MKRITVLLGFFVLLGLQVVFAQTKQITGTVTSSEDGMGIPGVSVVVKGTTIGVTTDIDGKYTLSNVPQNAEAIVFSFVGLKTVEMPANLSIINVIMESDTKEIDEVMVVAYGTAKKSSFTGSAAVVKREQLEKIQSTNFSKALEGSIAGVQVIGGTGQPGAAASIRIRGIGSVNASNTPLYVVDGAAYDGDINAIPSDDIESISVLKDAAAAALYGARGANGVIMVTTKKGKSGSNQVNVKVNLGVTSRAIPEYDRVSTDEWVLKQWEAFRNYAMRAGPMTEAQAAAYATPRLISTVFGGYNPYSLPAAEPLVGLDGTLNPNAALLYQDDWNKELAQVGKRQDYLVSFSGGTDATTFYGSANYLNEQGHVRWSDYERFSGRVGVTSKVKKWLKLEAGVSGNTSSQANFLAEGTYTTNPFYYGRMMGPIYPIYQRDAEGNIIYLADGSPRYDIGDQGKSHIYAWAGHKRPYAPNSNLLLTLPLDDRSNVRNQISARFAGEASFLDGFTFRVSGSTDINNTYYTTYQNNKYGDAESVQGRSTKEMYKTNSFTFNQVLTYNKEIGEHSITVMAGHENYSLTANDLSATRTGFKITTTELVAAAIAEGSTSYEDNYRLEGYLGQLKYSYADKYYVESSLRRDGSSRFAKDSRWGTFWSLSGSWRMKQEEFLANVDWLTDLKLKTSYGEQGNDAIGTYYGYQALFSIDDRNNGTFNGAWFSQLANDGLMWEKNANFNVGTEFSLLSSRIRGSVEYFVRKSDNLLFDVPRPQSNGLSSRLENIGTMVNKGIELQLSGDVVRSNDFTWTVDFNVTTYNNEVTKTPKDKEGKYQEIISGTKKIAVGHSIFDFWLRDYAGVDPATGDALYYMDLPDGTKGTTNDRNKATFYYSGSAIPDFYGGINNSFKFYGFDASIFFSYQIGGKFYDGGYAGLMHTGNRGTHWHKDILDSWSTTNTNTDVPRVDYNNSNQSIASSRWLTDASFLSLKNITVGYTLPKRLLSTVGFSSLRVYASGDNLALFSKRKGMDPQQSFGGTSDYTYVPVRIISFGLNLTF